MLLLISNFCTPSISLIQGPSGLVQTTHTHAKLRDNVVCPYGCLMCIWVVMHHLDKRYQVTLSKLIDNGKIKVINYFSYVCVEAILCNLLHFLITLMWKSYHPYACLNN